MMDVPAAPETSSCGLATCSSRQSSRRGVLSGDVDPAQGRGNAPGGPARAQPAGKTVARAVDLPTMPIPGGLRAGAIILVDPVCHYTSEPVT